MQDIDISRQSEAPTRLVLRSVRCSIGAAADRRGPRSSQRMSRYALSRVNGGPQGRKMGMQLHHFPFLSSASISPSGETNVRNLRGAKAQRQVRSNSE